MYCLTVLDTKNLKLRCQQVIIPQVFKEHFLASP
jgi:hypothetical protein